MSDLPLMHLKKLGVKKVILTTSWKGCKNYRLQILKSFFSCINKISLHQLFQNFKPSSYASGKVRGWKNSIAVCKKYRHEILNLYFCCKKINFSYFFRMSGLPHVHLKKWGGRKKSVADDKLKRVQKTTWGLKGETWCARHCFQSQRHQLES